MCVELINKMGQAECKMQERETIPLQPEIGEYWDKMYTEVVLNDLEHARRNLE